MVLLCSCVVASCGGGSAPPAAPAPSSENAAPPEAPLDASAPEPPSTVAAANDATSPPETSPLAGTVSSGSDAPDECSKSALPFEEKVRPLLNKCYQEGKKKNPDLSGTVRVAVAINTTGKVTSVKPSGTSELGDSVVQCMAKVVRDTPFDGTLCKSKTVVVSKTYGKK